MEDSKQNYFDVILDDVYQILNTNIDSIEWPIELNNSQRAALVHKMLLHYTSKQDFEKCEILNKILKSLNE